MSVAASEAPKAPPAERKRSVDLPPVVEKVVIPLVVLLVAILLPLIPAIADNAALLQQMAVAVAYVVMALGLNIVVGFAGLLDLGYVAFFALGAYCVGWFASSYWAYTNNQKGIHVGIGGFLVKQPGIHFNFLIVLVIAVVVTAVAGMIIGLPTLRLRGDYIAIVTLAFGEIIGRLAVNLDSVHIGAIPITAGRQGISPVDRIDLPFLAPFTGLNLKPWYWFALFLASIVLFVNFRLRDSRMGRAWVALREDEIAAVAMGVPAVKTKLMAYASGAAFGGISGAFLASLLNTVNADQFQFSFSILVLA